MHQASGPNKDAPQAVPVPWLTDPSVEDTTAAQESGLVPYLDLQTVLTDFTVSHSMYGLHLTNHPTPEACLGPDNVVPIGPNMHSESQTPSAHPQMGSTPVRPPGVPQITSAVSATMSSKNLGSTIHTAQVPSILPKTSLRP